MAAKFAHPALKAAAIQKTPAVKKKYPCHWDGEPCLMFKCHDCDKQIKNMEKRLRPLEKKQRRNRMKGCSHNKFMPRIDVCSECGEILTDLERMGYYLPEKELLRLLEANKKRGQRSILMHRKQVNNGE